MSEKTIDTLVADIYELIDKGASVERQTVDDLGHRLGNVIADRLFNRDAREPALRMSSIGQPCERKLWYSINEPEQGESLPPQARLKFLFGDILEELLLFLAAAAGHKVEGTQDTLTIAGVHGHRDAVIDGTTIDVKSASTYSFKKFEEGKLAEDDAFGYIPQLQSYMEAGKDDPLVTDKTRGAFLVIDKTLGNICLDVHQKIDKDYEGMYNQKKEVVNAGTPPPRGFSDEPEGKSGNRKLGINCSYCEFKDRCWPGLRTFLYSHKPVHLVKVTREPKVPEAKADS